MWCVEVGSDGQTDRVALFTPTSSRHVSLLVLLGTCICLTGGALAGAQVLTRQAASQPFASAYRDGRIVYVDQAGGPVMTIGAAGRKKRILRPGDPNVVRTPVWSPDGTEIAFASGEADTLDLYVMRADGTRLRRLTHGLWIGGVSWAPDGARLLILGSNAKSMKPRFKTWVIDADGENRRLLFSGLRGESESQFSPDGRHLVFTRRVSRTLTGIFRSDANGRHVTRIGNGRSPRWFPDGRSIVFNDRSSLWRVSAVGGKRYRIVGPVTPGGVYAYDLAPSGSAVVYTASPDPDVDRTEIVVERLDSHVREVIGEGFDIDYVDWQPRCTVYGTWRGDKLRGTAGADVICGLGGDDEIDDRGGRDTILGGRGNDVIAVTGRASAILFGSAGDDVFRRVSPTQVIDGGPGRDCVSGRSPLQVSVEVHERAGSSTCARR